MGPTTVTGKAALRGHTLIELLLALFLLALLASLVAPMVTGGIQRAKESALKEDLYRMRKAIDDYYADTNAYPVELEELVRKRYLRSVPADPLTDSRASWRLVWSEQEAGDDPKGIIDVRSGSDAVDGDGVAYAEW
jgi:general secretion pathway protein G